MTFWQYSLLCRYTSLIYFVNLKFTVCINVKSTVYSLFWSQCTVNSTPYFLISTTIRKITTPRRWPNIKPTRGQRLEFTGAALEIGRPVNLSLLLLLFQYTVETCTQQWTIWHIHASTGDHHSDNIDTCENNQINNYN